MASLGWRLRTWTRRLIPHTPVKRWGYGASLAALAPVAVLVGPAWAAGALLVLIVFRLVDMEVGRKRHGRLPTETAYFFEGRDHRRPRS